MVTTMKKNLFYIAVLLLVWTAASCTDDVIVNEQQQELRVTAGTDGQSRVTFVEGNGVTKTGCSPTMKTMFLIRHSQTESSVNSNQAAANPSLRKMVRK